MDYVAALIKERKAASEEDLLNSLSSSLKGLSIQKQLKRRQIRRFHVRLLDRTTIVAQLVPVSGGFEIDLDKDRVSEWCEDIGHELAHTFFYTRSRLRSIPLEKFGGQMTKKQEKRLENFCDSFAIRWRRVNKNEFVRLLSQYGFNQEGLNKLLKK